MTSPATLTAEQRTDPKSHAVRILQLTDCHFPPVPGQPIQGIDTEQSFSAVIEAVLDSGHSRDLLLMTGDLTDQPTATAYGRMREQLRPLTFDTPCYCLPGNHDDSTAMRRFLLTGQIRMETRIVLDRWQIIFLDSNVDGEPGGFLRQGQIDLLLQALIDQPEKHILVAVHHHPIACGSEWMDTMIITNGERLSAVLEAFPDRTRAVVFGHIHQALDRTVNGIRFLGSPSTCRQFTPRSRMFSLDTLPPGFRWMVLHPDGHLATEVVYLGAAEYNR